MTSYQKLVIIKKKLYDEFVLANRIFIDLTDQIMAYSTGIFIQNYYLNVMLLYLYVFKPKLYIWKWLQNFDYYFIYKNFY